MFYDYTIAITSCDRHDLLKRTLDSLVLDIPPKEILIAEDGSTSRPDWLAPEVAWLNKPRRMGQIHSADLLMQRVTTPYVLWCEDDWKFSEPVSAWLPRSQEILDAYPEVVTVSLRHRDCNGHPLVNDPRYPFPIQQPNWNGFGSFCFNPSLRRVSDYQRMGTYASLAGQIVSGCLNEQRISVAYRFKGYVIADFGRTVVRHTGERRSRATEKWQ
jgi:hypothetical protein